MLKFFFIAADLDCLARLLPRPWFLHWWMLVIGAFASLALHVVFYLEKPALMTEQKFSETCSLFVKAAEIFFYALIFDGCYTWLSGLRMGNLGAVAGVLILFVLLVLFLWIGGICGKSLTDWISPLSWYREHLEKAYVNVDIANGKTSLRLDREREISECYKHGAPLHIINMVLNGPHDKDGALRASVFSVGPAGVTFEVAGERQGDDLRCFALEASRIQGVKYLVTERLSYGTLIALSGAAFSPGFGTGSIPSRSFWRMVAFGRLGHWFDSDSKQEVRNGAMRSGLNLVWTESVGAFTGALHRYWYLSYGGHVENTGALELIRRGLDFIVVVDAGADPEFDFYDLDELNRSCGKRGGLGLELRVLEGDELRGRVREDALGYIGSKRELKECTSGKCAMLLSIDKKGEPHFIEERERFLLWVKLKMLGPLESEDIFRKAGARKRWWLFGDDSFTHIPTVCQNLDDNEWDALRILGRTIGRNIFAESDANSLRGAILREEAAGV
jgi:hypothetical protein